MIIKSMSFVLPVRYTDQQSHQSKLSVIQISQCIYIYIYMYMYVCMYVCMYVYIYLLFNPFIYRNYYMLNFDFYTLQTD